MTAADRRILLIEDDRFLRRAAEASLKRQGFTVRTAADGEEALTIAAAERFDLILLDLILPKLQGFEVLRGLKGQGHTASIPVIVLSNLGQEHDVERAMSLGAMSYFVKANLSLEELSRRVSDALEKGAA